MKRWVRAAVLLGGLSLGGVVWAQDAPRIGFVSTERILRESAAAKAAQQKLEQEFSRRDKELQESATRLRQLTEKLDREIAVLADGDRLKRQREIAELDRDFQRRQREFREDLNQRRNEELAVVVERANRVIKQLADQDRFDLIIQEAVFASPRIDITEKVLRALNGAK
jgi:outer membrane protein